MKGLLFFGFLLIVLLVASYGLTKDSAILTSVESFVNPGSDASLLAPAVVVPTVNPKPSVLEGTTPAPYQPPAEKQYGPPFGEIARVNTLPYKDPSLEAAPYKRIAELLESLKAFFAFEAKGLEKMSDPEIQLPLSTARGDLSRLTDEVAVLKRNPGIGSSITQGQCDDIEANKNYLQRKYRLSVNAASGLTTEEDVKASEGFENPPTKPNPAPHRIRRRAVYVESDRLSLKDLKKLRISILAEITRLSASGTTDPVITARINSLTQIKNSVDTLVTEVENGTRLEDQIPIMKMDVKKFLPLMSNPGDALPQLVKEANLPPSTANLFPAYKSGDASGAKMAQNLWNKYGDAVFNGLSWNINMKYTAPLEVVTEASKAVQALPQLEPVNPGLEVTGNLRPLPSEQQAPSESPVFMTAAGGNPNQPGSSVVAYPRGEMESAVAGAEMNRLQRQDAPRVSAPAQFDWRGKSNQICESIRKRGLNPADFGCIKASDRVGSDYSWRGHARMVCTRLLTTPDPGLPETCGCPPQSWAGWRS